MSDEFIHLRVHSSYSLSEGAIKCAKIPELARKAGMPAVAIADTGNLFGAIEFSQACVSQGIQPIIGCQLLLDIDGTEAPVVTLARTPAGIRSLQYLSSAGYVETSSGQRPHIKLKHLQRHADGLFLLTGGSDGPLGRLLADGRAPEAASLLTSFKEAFGAHVAVELIRHGSDLERLVEPGLLMLAEDASLPIVATNECFFSDPSMHEAHAALLCIAEGRQLTDPARRKVTSEAWFKTKAAMRAVFADLPDACDNTIAIARLCAAKADTRRPMLPSYPGIHSGFSEAEALRRMAAEGLERRLSDCGITDRDKYDDRLSFELGVIEKMGFPGYFLIVADFIQWAKSQGIPVGPGRGSGAASVVAWALTITDLDPLRYDLLFERFLNPERVSMPDFDIDFCQERRDEVIAYVRERYGADRVAQIITFGKLQARAAVRDVGRVLGLTFGQVNKVAELIPNNPAKPVSLADAIAGEKRLQQMRDEDEAVARLLTIAQQLEGLYRHASTHAAGVVIGDRPLMELVPVYRDPRSDMLVTQYSMKYVEQAGLVKFDFLGLTTLTILRRAQDFLSGEGINVDVASLPFDDSKTWQMLQKGDAGGIFQFEGQGMRDVLRQMRPDRIEDLIAAGALYRPGPMANIPAYCARKHGEKWDVPHPELKEILGETYGIMVYQEQVMSIAQRMAGYTLGGADLLRRAMGKKIASEMEAQRQIFLDGAVARGVPAETAGEVFDLMAKFAEYGFNKPHAAAYAVVSWQTAWMKANYREAFIAACMSLAINNTDRLASLRQEASRMGIEVLPPCINASDADFKLERQPDGTFAIRYGLAAVKRVGMAAMRAMMTARGSRPFSSLADFASRLDPHSLNKMQIENLARVGAFDTLEANRAAVFAGAETLIRRAQACNEERATGQVALFAAVGSEPERLRLPAVPDWAPMDRLAQEAEAIGFHLTSHPLDAYASVLRRLLVVPSNQLVQRAQAGAARVRLAGLVLGSKERFTRTGTRMAWVRMSDSGGSYEVTVFSELLSRARDLLAAGRAVLVEADVRLEGEALRITANQVSLLDSAAALTGGGFRVWLARTEAVEHVRMLLDREGKGRGRIVLVPRLDERQEVEVTLPGGWSFSPQLAQAMKLIPGVERVEELD
ncbi:MAG: DNA polymerase III subunit alpha [Alphaproteobacteria bacterium]|nr:DNA polymerase III subunit alpha [Alphaproteobacteria bacterium]